MKILFITLSNIGDVILTLPALDRLIAVYPKAQITVVTSSRGSGVFANNFYIKRVIIFDKKAGILKLFLALKKEQYDLIVDLRNSALPLFLRARHKTYPWEKAGKGVVHMRDRHLYKIRKFTINAPELSDVKSRRSICILNQDMKFISDTLALDGNYSSGEKLVVVSPGARSHIKRWPADKFASLCDMLTGESKVKVVIVGDAGDLPQAEAVIKGVKHPVINLCGKTTIQSLGALLEMASLVISNDSAVMHLASYLDRPVLAIFGATHNGKYGPWSSKAESVSSNLSCVPCESAQCRTRNLECLYSIKAEDVYAKVKKFLQ